MREREDTSIETVGSVEYKRRVWSISGNASRPVKKYRRIR